MAELVPSCVADVVSALVDKLLAKCSVELQTSPTCEKETYGLPLKGDVWSLLDGCMKPWRKGLRVASGVEWKVKVGVRSRIDLPLLKTTNN